MTRISFQTPLVQATFLSRPNRFLLQVRLRGRDTPVSVHLADPGRLKELLVPGVRVWLEPASNPNRKTRWTAILTETPDGSGLVSINTALPNRLIAAALEGRTLDEFKSWHLVRGEFPMGRSRIDFLLSRADGHQMALEVKSVTLVEGGVARFPDAITARGARHLRKLAEVVGQDGWEAGVLFVLQRDDATRIEAARSIDPDFADALAEARAAGVRVLGRRCAITETGMSLGSPVPVT